MDNNDSILVQRLHQECAKHTVVLCHASVSLGATYKQSASSFQCSNINQATMEDQVDVSSFHVLEGGNLHGPFRICHLAAISLDILGKLEDAYCIQVALVRQRSCPFIVDIMPLMVALVEKGLLVAVHW